MSTNANPAGANGGARQGQLNGTHHTDSVSPPRELRAVPQWICWTWEQRGEKRTKRPISPHGRPASTTNGNDWTDYETAVRYASDRKLAGVGFVFTLDDPFAGVDLDNCIDEAGVIADWAQTIIGEIDSYSEISPSGRGVKIFVRGMLPPDSQRNGHGRRKGRIEMYEAGRFFTLTGDHLPGTPAIVEERTEALETVYRRVFAEPAAASTRANGNGRVSLSDQEIIDRAMRAENGHKFGRLWAGDISNYPSDSEADLALCSLLAFWTGPDEAAIDRLFRQSGLFRAKWERDDYRARTIAKALQRSEFWEGEHDQPRLNFNANGHHTTSSDAESETDEAEPIPDKPAWPDPPRPEAFYGLAGEIVRALDPSTEADPVGLLVTLLSAVGNIAGPNPHWRVSGSKHGLRIDPVLVGETANGRKGTTWGSIRPLLESAASDWLTHCVKSGLSSGEGLIWAVRDEIKKSEPVKEKGRIVDYQEVVVDPGVDDKRLYVIEPEFASVLKVMSRDGNTLSATMRQAWDDGNLRTLTKNSPAIATGAHITITGHVTKDELLRYLDSTETGNGFANRFMFVCVRRSKLLPDGGEVDEVLLQDLGLRLADTLAVANATGLITRDAQASEIWRVVYGKLSEGKPGLSGSVLARAEAYVMRIAAIYAVLDQSHKITAAHLKAALALWQYVEDSTRYIFGDALEDTIADTILRALRQSGEMTRSEIVDLFGRHANRSKIDRGLTTLLTAGKATRVLDRETGGRPKEIWRAV